MDVAVLQAKLVADVQQFVRNMSVADATMSATKKQIESLEKIAVTAAAALETIRVSQGQAAESRAALDSMERSISSVTATAMAAADRLEQVKLGATQAAETRVMADSMVDSLGKVQRKAVETQGVMSMLGFGGGHGFYLPFVGAGLRGLTFGRGMAAFGSIAGLAGFGAERAVTSTLGIGGSMLGGLAGGALLGLGALGTTAVGMGTDMAGIGQAAGDIKNVSQAYGALTQAIQTYGRNSRQAYDAQIQLNQALGDFSPVARNAVLAAAQTSQQFKAMFDQATGQAEKTGAEIINQAMKTGEKFLPTIGKFAAQNMSIIQRQLQPFFAWLQNPGKQGGLGIFTDLERVFQRNLPTSIHAMEQGFELLMKTIDVAAQHLGGFIKKIDEVFTHFNNGGFKQWSGEVEKLIGLFDTWLHFWTALGSMVFDVMKPAVGFGQQFAAGLTDIINKTREWLNAAGTQDVLRSVFAAHLSQVQALFGLIRALLPVLEATASAFLQIEAAVSRVVSGPLRVLADLVRQITQFPLADKVIGWATALYLARRAIDSVLTGAGLLRVALLGLGPAAVTGAGEAVAAEATVGTTAVAAAGEVGGLRAMLLSLGGPEVLAAIGAAVGAYAGFKFLQGQAQHLSGGAGNFTSNGIPYAIGGGRVAGRSVGGYSPYTGTNQAHDTMRGAFAQNPDYTPSLLHRMAAQAAAQYGLPAWVFMNQIQQESGFKTTLTSSAGAEGIAQFMPGTARGMGVNPWDPRSALPGAARYDANLLKQYGGNIALALAAYNAGSGRVNQYLHGGRPLPQETLNYVSAILGNSPLAGGLYSSQYGTPTPYPTYTPPKPHPAGAAVLGNHLAAQLANAQAALTAAGVGAGGVSGGAGSFTDPKATLAAAKEVIKTAQDGLDKLNHMKATGKELVAIANERKTLEDAITSATRTENEAMKQIKDNTIAAHERAILGIGSNGATATPSILSLRARSATLATQIAKDAKDGINVAVVKTEIAKINEVLKNNFIPADVRQAITSKFQSIKQTLTTELQNALSAAQSAVTAMQSQVSNAFNIITNAADNAFQQNVQQHVAQMQILVNSPLGQFLFGGNITQTPAGAALQALQQQHTQQQLQKQLADAQAAVAKAQAGGGTVFDQATGIYSTLPGDPQAMLAAQQQLADAQYAIQENALSQQDQVEQQAANAQLSAAQQTYQQQQAIVQTAMDQQVQAIEQGMLDGAITGQDGWDRIRKIWSDAGIDLNGLSFALGGQIYTGLAAGLDPVFTMLKELIKDIEKVVGLGGSPPGSVLGYTQDQPGFVVPGFSTDANGNIIGGTQTGGGGDIHVHLNVSALDPASVDWTDVAKQATPAIRDELMRTGRRNGNVMFGSAFAV